MMGVARSAPGEATFLLGAKFMNRIKTLIRCALNSFMTGGSEG